MNNLKKKKKNFNNSRLTNNVVSSLKGMTARYRAALPGCLLVTITYPTLVYHPLGSCACGEDLTAGAWASTSKPSPHLSARDILSPPPPGHPLTWGGAPSLPQTPPPGGAHRPHLVLRLAVSAPPCGTSL